MCYCVNTAEREHYTGAVTGQGLFLVVNELCELTSS